MKFNKVSVGAGFDFGYSQRRLSILWKNDNVDLGSTDELHGNELSFTLGKAFVGPSASVRFKKGKDGFPETKITGAYDFGVNNNKWRPQYFTLENVIREKNIAQAVLDVIFNF
jgi:hypothetical protein